MRTSLVAPTSSTSSRDFVGVDAMPSARLGGIAILIILITLRPEILTWDIRALAWLGLAVSIVSLVLVARHATTGAWSMGFWYLIVLSLFHLGLAIPIGLGYKLDPQSEAYVSTWFAEASHRVEATYLSTLAVASFAAAYLCTSRRVIAPDEVVMPVSRTGGEATIGALLALLGAGTTLGYVAATNPTALFGISRGDYFESVAATGVDVAGSLLVTFAALLLVTAPKSATRTAGLIAVGIFGFWALATGSRTLIMYTVLAMIIVLARLRPMPKARYAAVVGVVGLVITSLVGAYRVEGVTSTKFNAEYANPVRGVVEMGGSIRPLLENVNYERNLDERALQGITYAAPTLRFVERLAGLPRPPGELDMRLAGNELRQRVEVYQLGYSAVAEAYRNWRTPGVVVVFALFGLLLGRLDSAKLRRALPAVYSGVVFFALVYHVRQPSTQFVPLLICGLLVAATVRFLTPRRVREPRVVPRPHL